MIYDAVCICLRAPGSINARAAIRLSFFVLHGACLCFCGVCNMGRLLLQYHSRTNNDVFRIRSSVCATHT